MFRPFFNASLVAFCLTFTTSLNAQGIPMAVNPAFSGAIGGGAAAMVWEQGKGGGGTYICGKSYSNDIEKADLLAKEASGECGASRKANAQNLQRERVSTGGSEPKPRNAFFTPSKARTRANLQTFVTKTRATDPAGAKQMEALFASTDVIGQIGAAMQSIGLRSDNAAHAYAVYWVSAWKASRGDSDTASAAAYQAVANQAAKGLSSSSEFARATDAQKQEMAEALMVQAALIDGHMEAAAGDAAQLKAVAQAVSKGAAASGLDLAAMTLTEQGFVPAKPRKRADASDGVQEPTALASTDQPAGTPEAPNYALIAGAAGAGLGAAFLIGKVMGKRG